MAQATECGTGQWYTLAIVFVGQVCNLSGRRRFGTGYNVTDLSYLKLYHYLASRFPP